MGGHERHKARQAKWLQTQRAIDFPTKCFKANDHQFGKLPCCFYWVPKGTFQGDARSQLHGFVCSRTSRHRTIRHIIREDFFQTTAKDELVWRLLAEPENWPEATGAGSPSSSFEETP
eukprot:899844-Amphidinium_carterae.1